MSNVCFDHLGNKFRSISEMCRYYEIERSTFDARFKKGIPLDRALSCERVLSRAGCSNSPCYDHLGNSYASQADMCKKYGVSPSNFIHRLERGWTLEEALCGRGKEVRRSLKIYDGISVTDHLGNQFRSTVEMCKFHKISCTTYYSRKKRGYSMSESLEGKNKKCQPCYDHLGNRFDSISAMCRYHGIEKHTYINRKKLGFPLEVCLSKKDQRGKPCVDSKGNQFSSLKKMCDFHGVNYSTFLWRRTIEKNIKS